MEYQWKAVKTSAKLPVLKTPVLIEGMPGIGNVGKVAADFMIDELQAKKIYDIHSHYLPHSVFVNEKNLVEMPNISLYAYKNKGKGKDFLFLTGDVQPINEPATYAFCEFILDLIEKYHCSSIITLGGIGLPKIPVAPKVYLTGNSEAACKSFEKIKDVHRKLYGVVGPVIGVSGLLLGLAQQRKLPAVSLLAETLGSPMYLGIKGSREIVRVLLRKFALDINVSELDKEIKRSMSSGDFGKKVIKPQQKQHVSYIG